MIYNCKCIHCGIVRQTKLANIKYKKSTKCTHYVTIGNITIPNLSQEHSIPIIRLRKIYIHILRRCYDETNKDYRFYGAKGVTVCDEWINNPSKFYQWSITHGYNNKQTIDRINETKGYSPENCRWISNIENARFKSNTNYVTATVTLSGKQWAELIPEHGINFINNLIRTQGKDKAREYLEKRLIDKHTIINTEKNKCT